MSCKPKKTSLRMADGGEAVSRWAGHQMSLRMQSGGSVPGLIGGDRLEREKAEVAASSIVKDASQRAGAAYLAGAGRGVANPPLVNPAAPRPVGVSPMPANPTDQRLAAGTQTSPGMTPGSTVPGSPLVGAPGSPTDIQWDPTTRTLSNAGGRAIAPATSPLTMGSAQNQQARSSLLARTPSVFDASTRPRDGLFMKDGGEAPPTSLRGLYDRITTPRPATVLTPAPAPAAPTPAPVASAPMRGISGYVANGALARREAAAGLQDGGQVPGSGEGDKIDAKYEPGEFVVSNDMIDDNPGLRETLHSLRAETLAARGKTVAEADAKAVKRGSLKAEEGFGRTVKKYAGQAFPATTAILQGSGEDAAASAAQGQWGPAIGHAVRGGALAVGGLGLDVVRPLEPIGRGIANAVAAGITGDTTPRFAAPGTQSATPPAASAAPAAAPAQPQAAAPVAATPQAPVNNVIDFGGRNVPEFVAPQTQAVEDVGQFQAPVVRHSGNDWEARNNLRNLAVSASSINQRRPRGGHSVAELAYLEALKQDQSLRGGSTAADVAGIKAGSEFNQSRNTLRGARHLADQRLRGDQVPLQAKQMELQYAAQMRGMMQQLTAAHTGKDGTIDTVGAANAARRAGLTSVADEFDKASASRQALAAKGQEMGREQSEHFRKTFFAGKLNHLATDKDGNVDVKRSEPLEQEAATMALGMYPGLASMPEAARNAAVNEVLGVVGLAKKLGKVERGGFTGWLPDKLSGQQQFAPTSTLRGADFFRGADPGTPYGGIEGALSPAYDKGDYSLKLGSGRGYARLPQLTEHEKAALDKQIEAANKSNTLRAN